MLTTSNKARIYAAAGTIIVALLVGVALWFGRLSVNERERLAEDKGEIVLVEEEFIDIMEMPAAPNLRGEEQATAHADEMNLSQPTPASGTDMANAGTPGDAPNLVKTDAESPVQEAEKPKKTGPSAEELQKQQEERQAQNEVTNAFSQAQGQHNTLNGNKDNGNAGKPTSTSEQGSFTGRGEGKAGGGWAIPTYGSVKSTVTGSIQMKLTINREGKVTNVAIIGGEAPALSNQAARNACVIEVKSRTFHRSNPDDAPETSTAYVTYRFR